MEICSKGSTGFQWWNISSVLDDPPTPRLQLDPTLCVCVCVFITFIFWRRYS